MELLIRRCVPLLLLPATGIMAAAVDTVITADGSPGPYRLGRLFVDTASITVSRGDSGYVPHFTYVTSLNGLLFSDPVDSGVVLQMRFETDYYSLPKVYSFYEKRFAGPVDSSSGRQDSLYRPGFSLQQDNLVVSGYKTVGVSVGSFGQVDLEQGLDIRIGGEIRPGTEITAHLNDQGTTLEGNTREISDFDMIYIALNDRRFDVVAGDQYIEWPFSGILEGRKKIKGIAASVHPGKVRVKGFGALAGGNFTVQAWHGDGGQGPYSFTGKGESGFITPIGGTIRVSVNGVSCAEGDDRDYTVDYDLGTMTFTARRLIRPEDVIRVEYEYKMFDYQRTLTGMTAGLLAGDSVLTVQGAVWSEIDNKNNPMELALTGDNINALKAAGDRMPVDTADEEVDPNDVLTRYASIPLYVKKDSLGTVIFVHTIPDPGRPDLNTGYFDVHFSEAADGCGDYLRESSEKYPDYIYRYAGPCGGSYTPLAELPAPQRRTSGEAKAVLSLPLLKLELDAAGQELDRNLFSGLDDNDNLASAATMSGLVGMKKFDSRSAWLGGTAGYWSRRFDREGLSAYERKTSWNDNALDETQTERLAWETSAGVTPLERLSAELTYGQQRADAAMTTDKAGGSMRWYPLTWLHLDYNGTYFRHFETDGTGSGQRQEGGASLLFTRHSGQMTYRDEWRREASGNGAGLMEGVLRYEFIPLHIAEEFGHTRFRKGSATLFAAGDTAAETRWQQSIDCSPFSWWSINGISTWRRRGTDVPGGRSQEATLLVDVRSTAATPHRSFTSEQHYRTTAEKASRFLQIPTYVGEGKGTHRWDSTMNEYVEDLHGAGDFIIQQRDVYDSTDNLRVRKTSLSVDWEYRPAESGATGILGDLSWEGTLYLEEHLDAEVEKFSSWMPGYLSLRNLSKEVVQPRKIRYSDLYYRQEMEWRPSYNREIRGRLTLTPDFRRIRSYRETGITGQLHYERRRPFLELTSETRLLALAHDDTSTAFVNGDFYLHELSATFSQMKPVGRLFEISLKECGGWARQAKTKLANTGIGTDSTLFMQLTPGLAWNIGDRGRVEGAYTFSLVGLPREHDYRIASGFASGISHLITVFANVRIGKYFSLTASYRGEIFRERDDGEPVNPPQHVVSMEVQAFL